MKNRLYLGLLSAALLLVTAGGVAAQEFRATVRGRVVDSSNAALPGATVNVVNQQTNEVATGDDEHGRLLHDPLPPAGAVHPDRRNERVPEVHPLGHDAPGRPDRRDQRHHGGGRRHRKRHGVVRGADPRNEPRGSRHGHRQRAYRGAAAAVAQPDGARRSRRRRQLQRAGDLSPSVRQRRARLLVDERRREQQQRVPARRRAEQRQPGRQQHRLRAAGGSRPGNENLHQLVRRAVPAVPPAASSTCR